MADFYYDIAQELRQHPSIRLQSKGTAWDRLYMEQRTLPVTTRQSRYPTTDQDVLPPECTPGAPHPKCAYLLLVDAYVTGGDDHHQNWALTYQVDVRAFAAAFPDSGPWEDMLADDGVIATFPAEDDSADITWSFTLVNPDTYTKPTQGTPHPRYPDCLFINETHQRQGQTVTITRTYHKVAPMTAQQKVGWQLIGEYASYDLLVWTYECPISAYASPPAMTICPIPGHANKYVIKPPEVVMVNALNCRVTVTYGRLPGPAIIMPVTGEGLTTTGNSYTQRFSQSSIINIACMNFTTSEVNGYSKICSWLVPSSGSLKGAEVNQNTGELTSTTETLSTGSSSGSAVNSAGTYKEVIPINKHYSRSITRSNTGLATKTKFTDWVLDELTGSVTQRTRRIVRASSQGRDVRSNGQYTTTEQLSTNYSLETTEYVADIKEIEKEYKCAMPMPGGWPDVLISYNFGMLDGQHYLDYDLKSYDGDVLAEVKDEWSKKPPKAKLEKAMIPVAIRWGGPGSFTIPPTLHGTVSLRYVGGVQFTKIWSPTNYSKWPRTITRQLPPERYKGGWLTRTVTYHSPEDS